MGKRADQAKKRRKLQSGGVKQIFQAQPPTPRTDGSPSPPALIEPEELETAVYVLQTLAENPAELAQKSMKELKGAVYGLHRVMAEGATLGESSNVAMWSDPRSGSPWLNR
jgi:hypothetical protein